MKRENLLAGLAARRFGTGRLDGAQKRAEVVRGARRIGSVGEVLERLRNARGRGDGAAVVRIGGDDRRDHQVLERREARLDIHPFASVPLDCLVDRPGARPAHRLCEVAK